MQNKIDDRTSKELSFEVLSKKIREWNKNLLEIEMNHSTHLINFWEFWSPAGSLGFNTNLLETNLINLTVVIGVLIYFGKGVCAN
jgi:hypothetical protein